MILVTGATGTTGSEVVRQLAASRVPVRAFVRNPDKAAPLRALGVEIVVGDLDRPETLGPALEDVERLFLLSPADPSQVEQQGRAVEMAQRAGVQHIVKMSVLGADPDSPIALGRWHAQTEQHIEKSGLHFTHLRPHY
ncbi:MAG: NAD(P)H-binding protein, partial [Candidatus Krumholzibacteriia bacterium]